MLGQLLLDRSAPKLPAPGRFRSCVPPGDGPSSDSDTHTLNQLFASIRMNKTDPSSQKQYISRLHDSARYAREASRVTHGVTRSDTETLHRGTPETLCAVQRQLHGRCHRCEGGTGSNG